MRLEFIFTLLFGFPGHNPTPLIKIISFFATRLWGTKPADGTAVHGDIDTNLVV